MPHPLPEALTAVLQLDRTAALAAAFVIGTHHADVLQWVVRTLRGDARMEESRSKPKANGAARRGRKANGHRKPRSKDGDPYLDRRRAQRDRDDESLLAVMRSKPEGSIGDWAQTIHKSRTSCVSGLHRLRDADLAESVEGKWKLVGPEAPRETAAKWIEPLSATAGRERRAHASA
jgi:hypothetical protein